MKKYILFLLSASFISMASVQSHGQGPETFSNAESNFKLVMEKLLTKYVDKNISKEQLYKAATAGMLSSLNSGEETWNKLLSPRELKELELDLSGKVTGIGAAMKFDDHTGYGQILKAIPGSPAEKAGLKTDDQILSVDGKKFKGQHLLDLVAAIRGEVGKSVSLKILREDKILNLSVRREVIPFTNVELESLDDSTALLTIGFFSGETPKLVEEKLKEINKRGLKKVVVDVRNNEGGGFDQAVKVAEYFLPENALIARSKNRDGKVEEYRAHNGLLSKDTQIILLTNKGTFCGAELLVAAIKENRKAKVVGESTFGKWTAQSVETLPNSFAIKYTVKEFQSPQGHTFQGVGIKPDLEVGLAKDTDFQELQTKYEVSKRLTMDTQLKAAAELIKSL